MIERIYMLILFVLLCAGTVCFANACDDDANYQFLYSAYQGENYLDLGSVNVNEYNPPVYEISAVMVHVDSVSGRTSSSEITIRYNYDKQQAYSYHERSQQWLKIGNSRADMVHQRGVILANAVFRAAYGMDFFH